MANETSTSNDGKLKRIRMELPKSKYDQALSKYNTILDDEEIRQTVQKIIMEKVPENDTPEEIPNGLGGTHIAPYHGLRRKHFGHDRAR